MVDIKQTNKSKNKTKQNQKKKKKNKWSQEAWENMKDQAQNKP